MRPLLTPMDDSIAGDACGAPFPSPFDQLGPPPLARRAAAIVQQEFGRGWIARDLPASALELPGGGKMFGVLVVADEAGGIGFLRAFSGTLGGRFDVDGYVPPIFDVEGRAAVEVEGERIVKALTARAQQHERSPELQQARGDVAALVERHRDEASALRVQHRQRRGERRDERKRLHEGDTTDGEVSALLEQLAGQSRRDKAEWRRLEQAQAEERRVVDLQHWRLERRVAAQQRLHRMVSRSLMRRIHDSYRIVNARGESASLRELFAPGEPPGGAGDCAAPKLLSYAFAHGLRPIAMAEFWWGAPPPGGGRISGAFYPACREKCGPLLPFLLEGLDVAAPRLFAPPDSTALELTIVFEDDWIVVVDKPCGLLSVPARGGSGGDSVLRRLRERYPAATGSLLVHRLDLDTSGLLVAARDAATHAALQRQFLKRSVDKGYVAVVDGVVRGDAGSIDLPLRVDLHDRPRQVVDPVHGRPALTEWRMLARQAGRTRVLLIPRTGRTHQLRVHAAHPLGLGAAVVGDRLYGRAEGERLLLHAESLVLDHPCSGQRVRFRSPVPF